MSRSLNGFIFALDSSRGRRQPGKEMATFCDLLILLYLLQSVRGEFSWNPVQVLTWPFLFIILWWRGSGTLRHGGRRNMQGWRRLLLPPTLGWIWSPPLVSPRPIFLPTPSPIFFISAILWLLIFIAILHPSLLFFLSPNLPCPSSSL